MTTISASDLLESFASLVLSLWLGLSSLVHFCLLLALLLSCLPLAMLFQILFPDLRSSRAVLVPVLLRSLLFTTVSLAVVLSLILLYSGGASSSNTFGKVYCSEVRLLHLQYH